jgi:hypothetical protein
MPQTRNSNFWGIGDVLRGTIQLFLLSKKLGFKLYVDTSLHPISKYLQATETPFSDLIQLNKDKIRMVPAHENLESYIYSLPDGISFLFTNSHITEEIDDDSKSFIREILRPNYILQEEIKKVSKSEPYNVMHFRLGDDELVRSMNNMSTYTIDQVLNIIRRNKETNDILISDSMNLKMNRDVLNQVRVIQTKPVHLGYCADYENIKDTLIDFFLLTDALKIKTYSCYDWISGFVYWAHKIYDIPLIKME